MLSKILHRKVVQSTLYLLMITGVGLCIFSEHLPISFRFAERYAAQIMVGYLIGGLVFLLLKQPRLMFASFGCCAALSIFLKYAQIPPKIPGRTPKVTKPIQPKPDSLLSTIKIAHFNISDVNEEIGHAIEKMIKTQADIISIQEVTPNWDLLLENELSETYPHYHTILDLGMFGMSIFSKHELIDIDTLYYKEVPNLTGLLALNNSTDTIRFVSSHAYPAFNASSLERLNEHLQVLTDFIQKVEKPLLTFGDYSMVSWSNELQEFRDSTGLQESRSGFLPNYSDGTISLFDVPIDHIFYTNHFKCLEFENLSGKNSKYLGIKGIYQLKKPNHVGEAPQ